MKGKPAIIIAILFGILGFVFVHLYLRSREAELLQIADERTVVVAVSDILPGTAIEENMVIETAVPLKFVQPSAFTSVREAVGQISAIPIQKDSQVLGTAMTSVGRSLATKIPRGMRAVSLAVTDVTGVSSLVAANNYVDMLATVKLGSGLGSSNQRVFVTTLFQNVMVLAVGSDLGEIRDTTPEADAMDGAGAAGAPEVLDRHPGVDPAAGAGPGARPGHRRHHTRPSLVPRRERDGVDSALERGRRSSESPEGEVVPRRVPSWQEIRSTSVSLGKGTGGKNETHDSNRRLLAPRDRRRGKRADGTAGGGGRRRRRFFASTFPSAGALSQTTPSPTSVSWKAARRFCSSEGRRAKPRSAFGISRGRSSARS